MGTRECFIELYKNSPKSVQQCSWKKNERNQGFVILIGRWWMEAKNLATVLWNNDKNYHRNGCGHFLVRQESVSTET